MWKVADSRLAVVFGVLRVAITGQSHRHCSRAWEIIGKEVVLQRAQQSIRLLDQE